MAERGSDKHGPRLDDDLHDDTRSLEQGAPVEARVEEALLADATANHAPEVVLERLQALPVGRAFENLQDVWAAPGGTVEHRV